MLGPYINFDTFIPLLFPTTIRSEQEFSLRPFAVQMNGELVVLARYMNLKNVCGYAFSVFVKVIGKPRGIFEPMR